MKGKVNSDIGVYSSQVISSSNVVGTCEAGSVVNITQTTDYWYYIESASISGWCERSSAITVIPDDADDDGYKHEDYKATVNSATILLRDSPYYSASIIGSVFTGYDIHITKSSGDWYYIENGGWYNTKDYSISLKPDDGISTDVSQTEGEKSSFELTANYDYFDNKQSPGYQILRSSRGIFAMPYQYMDLCDPILKITDDSGQVTTTQFGRKYAEKIVQNMPLLLLTPGKPKFMKKFSSADKKGVLSALSKNDENTLSALLSNANGKFYSLEFAYDKYFSVVNPMLKNMARLLNIQNKQIDGVALSAYNWQNYRDTLLQGFLSSKESVAFYIDSETQIQETFSNSTGQSSLSSSMNQLSDISREIQFLLGSTSGAQFEAFKQENYSTTKESLDAFVNKFSSILPSGIADRLTEGALTVAVGGKLNFPEIYNDSDFGKSYDVTVKLRTPDPNPFSIYMDLLVPLAHLIGLVAPIQLNGNGYVSPFLVRGYYKGMFDIDMGIITNMSITKGDKGQWTLDGLPTSIDVQFTIKDLYDVFSLSQEGNLVDLLNNTAEMDYLANLCGININNVDINRTIKYYYYNLKETVSNKLTRNHFLSVQTYASNLLTDIFGE